MKRLSGKVAVVTGAGSKVGIGREVALAMAAEGAQVVVNDISVHEDGTRGADRVSDHIKTAGGIAIPNYDSIATREGSRAIIKAATENFGRLDILVNTAANWLCKPFLEHTETDWATIIAVQLNGLFDCSQAAVEEMLNQGHGGRIITFTSSAAFTNDLGPGGAIAYCTAKAGIAGFTNALALELAEYDITVNAISPLALTSMFPDERIVDGVQVTGPDFVAPVVVYLATDEAKDITGQFIWTCGGEIRVLERPFQLPEAKYREKKDGKWTIEELIEIMPGLIRRY